MHVTTDFQCSLSATAEHSAYIFHCTLCFITSAPNLDFYPAINCDVRSVVVWVIVTAHVWQLTSGFHKSCLWLCTFLTDRFLPHFKQGYVGTFTTPTYFVKEDGIKPPYVCAQILLLDSGVRHCATPSWKDKNLPAPTWQPQGKTEVPPRKDHDNGTWCTRWHQCQHRLNNTDRQIEAYIYSVSQKKSPPLGFSENFSQTVGNF